MNLFAFRITDGLSTQPFEMYSEIEIIPFYFPRLVFTDVMTVFRQISCISAPIIRIIQVNGNIFKIFEQLPKVSIGSASIMPGQDDTRGFVYSHNCPNISTKQSS